ncbi:MAG TPA: hypothetical protein VEC16_06900 [Alphaproteobacteria bacterium]|nr:hypothetical protein [Alphaproteobacteria bacterium]
MTQSSQLEMKLRKKNIANELVNIPKASTKNYDELCNHLASFCISLGTDKNDFKSAYTSSINNYAHLIPRTPEELTLFNSALIMNDKNVHNQDIGEKFLEKILYSLASEGYKKFTLLSDLRIINKNEKPLDITFIEEGMFFTRYWNTKEKVNITYLTKVNSDAKYIDSTITFFGDCITIPKGKNSTFNIFGGFRKSIRDNPDAMCSALSEAFNEKHHSGCTYNFNNEIDLINVWNFFKKPSNEKIKPCTFNMMGDGKIIATYKK